MKRSLKPFLLSRNQGKWPARIGGSVLALALAGLLVPTAASAAVCDGCNGEEVIEVQGEAPWDPVIDYSHGGVPPNGTPAGDSGGGGGGGNGGGEQVPYDGGKTPPLTPEELLASYKSECDIMGGKWSKASFTGYRNVRVDGGWACRYKLTGRMHYRTRYYYPDSGMLAKECETEPNKSACRIFAPRNSPL